MKRLIEEDEGLWGKKGERVKMQQQLCEDMFDMLDFESMRVHLDSPEARIAYRRMCEDIRIRLLSTHKNLPQRVALAPHVSCCELNNTPPFTQLTPPLLEAWGSSPLLCSFHSSSPVTPFPSPFKSFTSSISSSTSSIRAAPHFSLLVKTRLQHSL